jgi:hypothetical protein
MHVTEEEWSENLGHSILYVKFCLMIDWLRDICMGQFTVLILRKGSKCREEYSSRESLFNTLVLFNTKVFFWAEGEDGKHEAQLIYSLTESVIQNPASVAKYKVSRFGFIRFVLQIWGSSIEYVQLRN